MFGDKMFDKRLKSGLMIGTITILFGVSVPPIEVFDDLWYHLLVGRYIFLHQSIPSTGFLIFEHTGMPMLYHSWLSELILYGVFKMGGTALLKVLNVVLGIVVGLSLYLLHRQKAGKLSFVILLPLIAYLAAPFLSLRPNVFSIIFFTIILVFLDKFRQTKAKLNLVPVAILMLIWNQAHGFWVYGAILTVVFWFEGIVRKDKKHYLPLTYVNLFILAFMLVGFGGIEKIVALVGNSSVIINNQVHEWISPIAAIRQILEINGLILKFIIFFSKVFPPLFLTFSLWIFLYIKKGPVLHWFLALAFGGLTLFSWRNIMFLLPIFISIMGPALDELFNKKIVVKKFLLGISVVLQLLLISSSIYNNGGIPANYLPLNSLTARLPVTENFLIVAPPNVSNYVLFLLNKDEWSDRNQVLVDIRMELYQPNKLLEVEELLGGNIENLPKDMGDRKIAFILPDDSPLLEAISKGTKYKVVGKENGYSLALPQELKYLSGN